MNPAYNTPLASFTSLAVGGPAEELYECTSDVILKAALDAAANAVKKGVIVVRSSRVPTGSVGRNVEVNDDELGFIASDELNPQKARILLSLALMKNRPKAEIQNLFYTY